VVSTGATTRAFRSRAVNGERLLGTVVASPDIALAEIVAAHFDFLWIDLEHSALHVRDVQSLCIAARASGCATLVRVSQPASGLLTALLDAGVNGVIAPRVDDVAVAAGFAARLRYPPDGSRGFAHRRATAFGLDGRDAAAADNAPLCMIQIESGQAVQRAEELARVPGIDGLIVGPSDLAFDLGLDPSVTSTELLAAVEAVQAAAARAGKICGLAAGGDNDAVAQALGDTTTLLAYSADVRIYAAAIEAAASSMTQAWRAVAPAHAPS
jgi:2-keto-3-deoxy-L-rhamnonate aldolase RhmA